MDRRSLLNATRAVWSGSRGVVFACTMALWLQIVIPPNPVFSMEPETRDVPVPTGKKGKKGKKDTVSIRGTFLGQARYQDRKGKPDSEFLVDMARIKLGWKPTKRLRAVLQTELSGLVTDRTPGATLRNAYVQYKLFRGFSLRMGQFKKPFSRLELTGRYSLPLTSRGEGNDLMSGDLGFAGRDIGLEIRGKLRWGGGFQYKLGIFNGSGMNQVEADLNGAKDLAGRVEWEPTPWLTAGTGLSLKMFDTGVYDDDRPSHALAAGGDVLVSHAGLSLWLEGAWFENYLQVEGTSGWWTMAVVTYDWAVPGSKKLTLQPVAGGELLAPSSEGFSETRTWAFTPGVNLLVGRKMKVMLQGRFVMATAASGADDRSSRGLILQWGVSL